MLIDNELRYLMGKVLEYPRFVNIEVYAKKLYYAQSIDDLETKYQEIKTLDNNIKIEQIEQKSSNNLEDLKLIGVKYFVGLIIDRINLSMIPRY